jgi:hypothetical protein
MRILGAAIMIAAVISACGGSDSSKTPTPRPTLAGSSPTVPGLTPIPTPTGGATPEPSIVSPSPVTAATPGASVEVVGIVGSVETSARAIEIRRLQGASVTRIELSPTTVIRKATGGTVQLAAVRTSDRIVAKGSLNDRHDAVIATEITVQDVLPGAQPGG